ncbi:Tetraspanin-7-like [Oopsacas minuta]|uniref:Tetraspanin n=1 Tax=Oopsacas minuta TaxID=111878 RepID=A0AAV7JV64_9METZ|nr:Tetraspanin-7-like [Oopsacas minuta]
MGKKALVSKLCIVTLLILINLFAVVLSLFLISAGITLIVIASENALKLESLLSLIAILLALGVLFLLISILGFISSISSIPSRKGFRIFSTISLTVYMIVLLVLILAQIGAVIAGLILRDNIATDGTLNEVFEGFVQLYTNPAVMAILDGWQNGFGCCGYINYTSWYINDSNFTSPNLPDSCCNITSSQQCNIANAYTDGCSPRLLDIVTNYLGAVIGVFAGISVFQIAVLIVNLFLICCIWLDKTGGDYDFKKGQNYAMGTSYP